MTSPRPLPMSDLDTAPWWEALARHELLLQQCDDCGRYRWPPRGACNDCGSFASTWIHSAGRGVIESWTVTHHSFGPQVETPFVVALVRLDEQDDIFIPGYVEGPGDGSHLRLGMPVEVGFGEFEAADSQVTLIRWRPLG